MTHASYTIKIVQPNGLLLLDETNYDHLTIYQMKVSQRHEHYSPLYQWHWQMNISIPASEPSEEILYGNWLYLLSKHQWSANCKNRLRPNISLVTYSTSVPKPFPVHNVIVYSPLQRLSRPFIEHNSTCQHIKGTDDYDDTELRTTTIDHIYSSSETA